MPSIAHYHVLFSYDHNLHSIIHQSAARQTMYEANNLLTGHSGRNYKATLMLLRYIYDAHTKQIPAEHSALLEIK